MTETQLRFLRAIGERVAVARVAELYLFPPMRQGNMESGIAVIAAVLEERDSGLGTRDSDVDAEEPIADVISGSAEACDPTEDASRDAPSDDEVSESRVPSPESPPFESPLSESRVPSPESRPSAAAPPRLRHTVYTARYRLTLKGPERGRWELHVIEEADAPLLSVDLVVRGVQRRIGEGAEPERLEPAALRELLEAPAA